MLFVCVFNPVTIDSVASCFYGASKNLDVNYTDCFAIYSYLVAVETSFI